MLANCYSSPIVHQFRHHEELVLMLDQSWTHYYLLDDLNESTFEQKLINSLILQLYTILENCENNNCNELPQNTINSIIICSSINDILLIIPLKNLMTGLNVYCPQALSGLEEDLMILRQNLWHSCDSFPTFRTLRATILCQYIFHIVFI